MTQEPQKVLRETDADAIRLAKTLIRTARHGALATLEPGTGRPLASRVGTASDTDGTPVVFISRLATHTGALLADPRCSLLLGQPGKGDPLAHARLTLACDARAIDPAGDEHARIAARYLAHNDKAALYAQLPDFAYFRLEVRGGSLNAGFGRAYSMSPAQLLSRNAANEDVAAMEHGALAHMNAEHAEAIGLYARHFANAPAGNWRLTGIDAEGIDIADGDDLRRIFFPAPLTDGDEVRPILVQMARTARAALEA